MESGFARTCWILRIQWQISVMPNIVADQQGEDTGCQIKLKHLVSEDWQMPDESEF
jgi:hypothetical protein